MKKRWLLIPFVVSMLFANEIEMLELISSTETNTTVEAYKMGQVSKIYYDYNEALALAKEEKKNLFIFFQRKSCPWCKKLRNTTFQDETLTKQIDEEYVVLLLDIDQTVTYPKKYKVMGVPVVYLVDTNEKVHVIEQGYSADPKGYIELLNICTQRTKMK